MNEITNKADFGGTPMVKDDVNFEDHVKVTSFLKRVQLIAPGAALAAPTGPCTVGNYYLIGSKDDVPIDLGNEFDFTVAAMKFKALSWNDNEAKEECDMDSEEFKEVQRKQEAGICKSNGNDTHEHAWGPEFLIWLNDHNCFAHFFMGSKSARTSSQNIYQLWHKQNEPNITANSHLVVRKFKYWVTQSRVCSTEPAYMPTQDELNAAREKFNQAPEKVEEEESADR